ncbi:MAG: hypothetical protein M3389_08400 [Actinomycetota bacterium]|nr:hypothetical protein [Actinomycetota bacterium]
MSTLLYAHLTSQRNAAPTGTSTRAAAEAEPAEAGKPGVGGFVDALAALVPAEILAAHAILIGLGSETKGSGDTAVTTITEPDALKVLMVALAVVSVVLYVLVHARKWDGRWDYVRMLIPALAFVGWTMLQKATMFDAWAPNWSEIARTGTGLILAIVLGGIAYALAYKADAQPAT